MQRPDLTGLAPDILAYIKMLEAEIESTRGDSESSRHIDALQDPSEPPTPIHILSVSAGGMAKRTLRHLYLRQRRGGMGVFDLDTPESDPPAFVVMADGAANLILLTDQGRAFRLPVSEVPEREVRGRGESLLARFPIRTGERLAIVTTDTPVDGGAFLLLVSERGQIRRVARQYIGANLQPGTVLCDPRDGGAPAAACWSQGADEVFIVTRSGLAIRFSERQVPVRGCLGLRVNPGDRVAAVAAAPADGGVFLLSQDGKGTVRLMPGFSANKSPGSGGKVAMKADVVVGAHSIDEQSDLFMISRLGKMIRFRASEVPAKEGVVQGVNCMNLRADDCVALTAGSVAAAT